MNIDLDAAREGRVAARTKRRTDNGRPTLAAIAALLGSLIGLTGCIQIDQTLTVNPNGSGTYHIIYGMSEQSIAQMDAMQILAQQMDAASGKKEAATADPELLNPFLFEEEGIRKLFKKYEANGITLGTVKLDAHNNWKTADLNIRFRSLAELAKIDLLANSGFSLTRTKDGSYRMVLQAPTSDRSVSLSDPETEKSLSPMLAGFKMRAVVNTPGKLLDTNAYRRTTDSASWDVDYDSDPRQLARLQRDGMYVLFDGKGLNLPEIGAAPQPVATGAARPAAAQRKPAP